MPTESLPPRVALVHDWLNGYRGGERVLEAICELFPGASVFTLFHERGSVGGRIEKHPIRSSFLNRLPAWLRRRYRFLLPFFPLAIERFDLRGYDLVISSSHCVAKGIIPGPRTLHLCFCHTTMRYAWDHYRSYFSGWKDWIAAPLLHYLRMWDVTSSARVDRFVANSGFVADRIRKYYRREASVAHPFVDLKAYHPIAGDRGNYYLVVSAMVPYKRIDIAIEACRELDRDLIVVGSGPECERLQRMAGPRTRFLGMLRAGELRDLYGGARALLFPGEEDFGITPLEAMACGTPVIAFGSGGVRETVVDGETGLFFHEQTVPSLARAMQRLEAATFSAGACRAQAERFSKARFQRRILEEVRALDPERAHRIFPSIEIGH